MVRIETTVEVAGTVGMPMERICKVSYEDLLDMMKAQERENRDIKARKIRG